eukprot:XP_001706250.1 Hypothetical protein GL50803_5954 [Giardia lamblia ATCC 50803]
MLYKLQDIHGHPTLADRATHIYSFDALPSIIPTPAPAPAPSSTRKTAMIAGVSVAAVLLVGSVVGFLLWWFLYRRTQPYGAKHVALSRKRIPTTASITTPLN